MQVRKLTHYLLLIISIVVLSGVLIVDLFSTNSSLLSELKGNSDFSMFLFLNKDIYQYHLSIMGWKIAYPNYFIPVIVLYLLFGLVSTGFYSSILVLFAIVILTFLTAFWLLNLIFKDNLSSKWHISIFLVLMMALLCTNSPMLTIFPTSQHHGGTISISFLFLALALYYLKTFRVSILILLSILNILLIYSDLLYLVSCVLPFAITFLIINLIDRKFDRASAVFFYALAVSTLIGLLCGTYLRFLNYSPYAVLITSVLSLLLAFLLLPLIWLPEFVHWLSKNWKMCKVLIWMMMSLGILAFVYMLFSHSFHHFVRVFFNEKIHFHLSNSNMDVATTNNFFQVIKTMLHLMLFGKPYSITIWFKFFLLIPILAFAYLLAPSKYQEKFIPPQYGKMIVWFLLVSVIVVFFANVFTIGLKTFLIPGSNYFYNLRYFIIPIFFGLFIIGFALANRLRYWSKTTLSLVVSVMLIVFIYPQLATLNFSAYANNNLYNNNLNSEEACLLSADKKYHLHYGLANYFFALAVDNYMPKNIFINSILPTGKIFRNINNVYWFVYNPNTGRMPIYNFIVTGGPGENSTTFIKRYGAPDKIINCGYHIHLWVYQKPSAIKQLSDAVFQQVINKPLVRQFLTAHHLSFH